MMLFLYTCAMTVLSLVVLPAAGIAALFGKTYLWRRFRLPGDIPAGGDRRIWIHAASVGEAGIAFSLAAEMRARFPGCRIFVSTATESGRGNILRMNASADIPIVDTAFLAPVDQPFVTGRFVRSLAPTVLVLVETELWPWLILSNGRRGIPVAIVNGKLGKRGFRRYMIFRKGLTEALSHIRLVCAQSRSFSKRFAMLGIPPQRLHVLGNVKFDGLPDRTAFDRDVIRRKYGIPSGTPLFTAGSTRPGEEEILAGGFSRVLNKLPSAVMVVAPRHLNRLPEVESVLRSSGLSYRKRSDETGGDEAVLVLDTMGELLEMFAASDVAFVGGSLSDFGGHNPLEPAALGVPVLFGPYMEQTGAKELLSDRAARLVHDEDDLAETLNHLLPGGDTHAAMSDAGPKVVRRFTGTLSRTLTAMSRAGIV